MRITKHIYERLKEEFGDDFFCEEEKAQSTSTIFSEFLPVTALSNPSGSPWGQYGDREIPLKRKTIVISFKDLNKMSFSAS